jgi:hypothetical protein
MSFLLDHEVLNLLVTLVGVYSIMSLSCDHMIYPFRESMQGLCDGFYCGGVAHMPTGYSFIQYFYASHAFNHVSLSIVQTSLSFLHSKKPLYQSKTHSKHYIVTRNPVYSRRLDPSVLAFSFSLYRHPSIYILCSSRFTSHNKHLIPKDLTANNTQERRTTIGIRMMVVRNSPRWVGALWCNWSYVVVPRHTVGYTDQVRTGDLSRVRGQINQLSHGIVVPFRSFQGR